MLFAALCLTTFVGAIPARPDLTSDKKGETLLREVAARYASMQSLTAEFNEDWQGGGKASRRQGKVWLQKPNHARMEVTEPSELCVWDGTRMWRLLRDGKRYTKTYVDAPVPAVTSDENPVELFFCSRELVLHPVAEHIGSETVGGVNYEVVEATLSHGRERLYVGADLLVHRITGTHNGRSFVNVITNVLRDPDMDAATFRMELPEGAHTEEKAVARNLIPVGSVSPDFVVKTFGGAKLRLATLLKYKKAVILHFWAYG